MRLHGQVICKTGGLSCWSLSLSLAGLMTQVTLGNCTWEKLRQSLCLPAASSQQETEALCPTNAGHYILPITGHSLEAILPRSSVQIRQEFGCRTKHCPAGALDKRATPRNQGQKHPSQATRLVAVLSRRRSQSKSRTPQM